MESEQTNIHNVCRTCKNESPETKSLYHRDSESGKENLSLHEMLIACTTVQVNKEDDLPKIICQTCFVQLKNAYCFKEQCEKTDVFLRDYLNKVNRAVTKEKVPSNEREYASNIIVNNESTPDDTNHDKDVTEDIRNDPGSRLGEPGYKDGNCGQVSFVQKNLLRSLLNGALTKDKLSSDRGLYLSNITTNNESTPNDTNNDEDVIENIRDNLEFQSGYKDMDYVQVFRDLAIYQCRTCSEKVYTIDDLRNHKKVQHNMQLDIEDNMGEFSIRSNEKEDEVEGLNMDGVIIEPKVEVFENNDQDKIDEIAQFTNETYKEENLSQMFVDIGIIEDEIHKEYEAIEGGINLDADNEIEYESEAPGNVDSECVSRSSRKYPIRDKPSKEGPRDHPPRIYECETCNKKFSKVNNFNRHKLSHVDVKPYLCAICKKCFARKDHLARHMKLHSGADTYNCDVCNKKFCEMSGLRRHKLSHLDVKPNACAICKKRFAQKGDLSKHMKLHTGTESYNCDACERVFYKEENLTRHKAFKHNIGKKVPAREKNFKCQYCKKGFATEMNRDTHVQAHFADKKVQCKTCEKTFKNKRYLTEHMKLHNGSSKKFLCTECGKGFIRNDYLVIHMMRHRGEKPFKCKFCGKGFPRTIDLTVHERCHTGETTHLCVICGKGFGRLNNLRVHMRTHTGEKPFRCTHCDAAFAQRNDMKIHVRRHTGERLQCEMCPKTFLKGYLLTQHKKIDHGLNIVSNVRRLQRVDELNPDDPPSTTVLSPTPVVLANVISSDALQIEDSDMPELKQE